MAAYDPREREASLHLEQGASSTHVPASAPANVTSFFLQQQQHQQQHRLPTSPFRTKPAIKIMTTTPSTSNASEGEGEVSASSTSTSTSTSLSPSPRTRRVAPPPAPLLLSSSASPLSSPSSLALSAGPLTPSFSSSKKHRNAKQLSLLVPGAQASSSSTSTSSTSSSSSNPHNNTTIPSSSYLNTGLQPPSSSSSTHQQRSALTLGLPSSPNTLLNDSCCSSSSAEKLLDLSETRSCPPTPRLVIDTAEQTNQVMLDQAERDEIKSSLTGDLSMRRRSSLPRLSILASKIASANDSNIPPPTPSALRPKTGVPALTVEALVARNREAGAPLQKDSSEAGEEFPYQYGPKEILPGLFLGSEQNAKDPHILRRLGITQVLCCAKEVSCPWLLDDIIQEEEDGEEDAEDSTDNSDTENHTHAVESDMQGRHANVTEDEADTSGDSALSYHLAPPSDASRRSSRSSNSAQRPTFLRPTASTPNLKRQFMSASYEQDDNDSAPHGGLNPPSALRSPHHHRHPDQTKRATQTHMGYLHRHFSANRLNGRPAIEYTKLPWGHDEDDVAKHFETFRICEIIDKARRNGGRCLVHCQLGVSRSATLMIGYCMRQAFSGRDEQSLGHVKSMHDSYTFVREKSRWVAPNIGLLAQLVQYERVLATETSPSQSLPYTNSAYYDSQLALPVPNGTQTPDNLSPSSTSESEVDSRLTTPDAATELHQPGNAKRVTTGHPSGQALTSPFRSSLAKGQVEEQLSPMTAAMGLSQDSASPRFIRTKLEHTSFGSAQRKKEHKKTFSADLSNFARTFAPYPTHE